MTTDLETVRLAATADLESLGPLVEATGPIVHLCPHVDETDHGHVTISWHTAGSTIELHSLARHLKSYADQRISHEDLAETLWDAVDALDGLQVAGVVLTFKTAGLECRVSLP